MDVETDGEPWHAQPERAAQDKLRDRDLESLGWRVIRTNGYQVQEQMEEYCVRKMVDSIDSLGGLKKAEPDS